MMAPEGWLAGMEGDGITVDSHVYAVLDLYHWPGAISSTDRC